MNKFMNKNISILFFVIVVIMAFFMASLMACNVTLINNDNDSGSGLGSGSGSGSGSDSGSGSGSGSGGGSLTAILDTTATTDLSSVADIQQFEVVNDQDGNHAGIFITAADAKIYIIELEKGKTAADASSNDISSKPYTAANSASTNSFYADIKAVLGATPSNSRLASGLILASNLITQKTYVVYGNTIMTVDIDGSGKLKLTKLDLSSIDAAVLEFNSGTVAQGRSTNWGNPQAYIHRLAWAKEENRLYASVKSAITGLDGAIAWAEGPFSNGDKVTDFRGITFYSSVDPSSVTKAPIDIMAFAQVGNKGVLTGVNTCSPGFSVYTDELRSTTSSAATTNIISLVETFNLNTLTPDDIVFQTNGAILNAYVARVSKIHRVGQPFVDGTYSKDASKSGSNALIIGPGFSANFPAGISSTQSKYVGPTSAAADISAYKGEKLLYIDTSVTDPKLMVSATSSF